MSHAPDQASTGKIHAVVLGAGAIGRYLALALAHGDENIDVTCLVRSRDLVQAATQDARSIHSARYPASLRVRYVSSLVQLPPHEVALVTVKSKDTSAVVAEYLEVFPSSTPMIMLQNGLSNPARARAAGAACVLPALVAFNVVLRDGCWCQATDGPIEIDAGSEQARSALPLTKRLTQAWTSSGERALLRTDIDALMRGKLLLNLNNGLCAIAGVSIAALIRHRDYRRCLALLIEEGLAVYRRAGLPARSPNGLPPSWIPAILKRADPIFFLIARAQIRIDPGARSSTLQDLEARKSTEIDDLSGAICELASRVGTRAPLNQWVCDRVHQLEAAGQGPGAATPRELLSALRQVARQV